MLDPLQQYSGDRVKLRERSHPDLSNLFFRHLALSRFLTRFSVALDPLPTAALARIIGRLGGEDPDRAIGILYGKLSHRSAIVRSEVSLALFNLIPSHRGDFGAMFQKMLEDSSPRVRRNGFRGLVKLGHSPDGAGATAYDLLSDRDESIRRSAAFYLLRKNIHVAQAISTLGFVIPSLSMHQNPGYLKNLNEVRSTLCTALKNEHLPYHAKAAAVQLLASLPSPTSTEVALFRECLDSEVEIIRFHAASALARIRYATPGVVAELVRMVKASEYNDEAYIVDTLLKNPRLSAEAIVDALPPFDLAAHKRLGQVLRKMPDHAISPLLDLLVEDGDQHSLFMLKRFAERLILGMKQEALNGLELASYSDSQKKRDKARELYDTITMKAAEKLLRTHRWR